LHGNAFKERKKPGAKPGFFDATEYVVARRCPAGFSLSLRSDRIHWLAARHGTLQGKALRT